MWLVFRGGFELVVSGLSFSSPPFFIVLDVCEKESFLCSVLKGLSKTV